MYCKQLVKNIAELGCNYLIFVILSSYAFPPVLYSSQSIGFLLMFLPPSPLILYPFFPFSSYVPSKLISSRLLWITSCHLFFCLPLAERKPKRFSLKLCHIISFALIATELSLNEVQAVTGVNGSDCNKHKTQCSLSARDNSRQESLLLNKQFTDMSVFLSPPISLHHQTRAFYAWKANYFHVLLLNPNANLVGSANTIIFTYCRKCVTTHGWEVS